MLKGVHAPGNRLPRFCVKAIGTEYSGFKLFEDGSLYASKDEDITQLQSVLDDENDGRKHVDFGFKRWDTHRLRSRHIRHILTLGGSRVFQQATPACLVITGVAALAPLVDYLFGPGTFPHISPTPFTLTSAVLGLLLVFRTNASYDRYWEGRKLWARTIQCTRDISRQSLAWIQDDALRMMALRYIVAFPISLKCHLVENSDFKGDLKSVLLPEELDDLLKANHKPLHVLQVLTDIQQSAGMSEFRLTQMDINMTVFEDCLGACERILRCPIPASYTRHTSRFLIVFSALLPLVLWKEIGLSSIPATFMITYAMLGIEQIGVEIEEPFSLLPLGMLCVLAGRDVSALAESSASVRRMVNRPQGDTVSLINFDDPELEEKIEQTRIAGMA